MKPIRIFPYLAALAILLTTWPLLLPAQASTPLVDLGARQPGDVLAKGARGADGACVFEPVEFVLPLVDDVAGVSVGTDLAEDCTLVLASRTVVRCEPDPSQDPLVDNARYQASLACSAVLSTVQTELEEPVPDVNAFFGDFSNGCLLPAGGEESRVDLCDAPAIVLVPDSLELEMSHCGYTRTVKTRIYSESWWNRDVTGVDLKLTFRYHCATSAKAVAKEGECWYYEPWGWKARECFWDHGARPSSTSVQRGVTGTFSDGCCSYHHTLTTRIFGENSGTAQCTYAFSGSMKDGPHTDCWK